MGDDGIDTLHRVRRGDTAAASHGVVVVSVAAVGAGRDLEHFVVWHGGEAGGGVDIIARLQICSALIAWVLKVQI